MAKIVSTTEQTKALEVIEQNLKSLSLVSDAFTEDEIRETSMTVKINNIGVEMPISYDDAKNLLINYKNGVVKQINDLASKFSIELEDKDKELM